MVVDAPRVSVLVAGKPDAVIPEPTATVTVFAPAELSTMNSKTVPCVAPI